MKVNLLPPKTATSYWSRLNRDCECVCDCDACQLGRLDSNFSHENITDFVVVSSMCTGRNLLSSRALERQGEMRNEAKRGSTLIQPALHGYNAENQLRMLNYAGYD